jgi:signal transduction histidine kinase
MAANKITLEKAQSPLTFQNIWQSLTRPHDSIIDIEERRQAQLLAALQVCVLLVAPILSLLSLMRAGSLNMTVLSTWIGIVITLGLYALNRSGRYRLSAYLFLALNFALVYTVPIISNDPTWLFLAPMLFVIAAMLLPGTGTIIFFVITLATQLVIGAAKPLSAVMTNFSSFLVYIIVGTLVLVFLYHRTQLEKERRAELQAANQRLRESESVLEHRVEERTRDLANKNVELEVAWETAKRADLVKSQFLASMSHELRTPLNAILNFTEFVSMGMLGPVNDKQQDALTKSLDSGRHLLTLINDVLDITKIESGMLNLFIEENVDLSEILTAVQTTATTLLKDKPVQFVPDIDTGLPVIVADRRRIRQVLLNLISNACKFTEEGSITLSVKNEGPTLLFCVADTGPGIAQADQARIFEPFEQTEKGVQHSGGTGLGLPISKRLVEAHEGTLWVESEAGKGASFFFRIPINSQTLIATITKIEN